MITLTYLLIAYLMRRRFMADDTPRADRVLYYLFSVVMTPLLGPWVWKVIVSSKVEDDSRPGRKKYGYTLPSLF